MEIIKRIEELLDEKGISGAKMSRDLGFSNAVYSQWRSGKQNPSLEKLQKMADYFGVSTDYLSCKTDIRNGKKNIPPEAEKSALSGEKKKGPLVWGYDDYSVGWTHINTKKDKKKLSDSQTIEPQSEVDAELFKLIRLLPDSEKYKLIGRIQATLDLLK